MKKGSFVIILLFVGLFGYEVFGELRVRNKLVVVFCDVGQGDGAFIRTPKGHQILIDTGPNASILKCISSNLPFWDKHLDLIILSHFNMDHVAGTIDILNRYSLKRIAIPTELTDREDVRNYMTLIRSKNIVLDEIDPSDTYKIENNLSINTLGPLTDSGLIEDNDSSLVQVMSYKDYDILFTGDASHGVLNPIFDTLGKEIEILKVPHHGSKTGLNGESFRNFQPQIAVISAGEGNRYGHPTKEIVDLLEKNQIQIRRTDEEGSIKFVLDE